MGYEDCGRSDCGICGEENVEDCNRFVTDLINAKPGGIVAVCNTHGLGCSEGYVKKGVFVSEEFNVKDSEDKSSKFRMSLLPIAALKETAKVFQWVINEGKYKQDDWRKGVSWRDNYDSLMRHLTSYYNREDRDSETGLLHLAHAADRVLMALEMQLQRTGNDDRFSR